MKKKNSKQIDDKTSKCDDNKHFKRNETENTNEESTKSIYTSNSFESSYSSSELHSDDSNISDLFVTLRRASAYDSDVHSRLLLNCKFLNGENFINSCENTILEIMADDVIVGIFCCFHYKETTGGKKRRKVNQLLSNPFCNGLKQLKKQYIKEIQPIQIFFFSSYIEVEKMTIKEAFFKMKNDLFDQLVIIHENYTLDDCFSSVLKRIEKNKIEIKVDDIYFDMMLINKKKLLENI